MIIILSMMSAGCGVLEGKPVAPPAPTGQAQEISRDQAGTLTMIGRVSALERGSPMDAEDSIRAQANARRAGYYQIIMLSEDFSPGIWRAEAILYR
ncbi:biofilm peroxide resistance protein BsmA [Enterobacteriales bacterium SAP-6]|uniref:Biofilm peroxide resistance protein BsmA n=2 Tax=Acerihabitans arboris TaxID=2691583 RepID=A0A845SJC4_9GAMM|nr:biofilm peroxide resistance protein BsmA [Acerihabitans arboris]